MIALIRFKPPQPGVPPQDDRRKRRREILMAVYLEAVGFLCGFWVAVCVWPGCPLFDTSPNLGSYSAEARQSSTPNSPGCAEILEPEAWTIYRREPTACPCPLLDNGGRWFLLSNPVFTKGTTMHVCKTCGWDISDGAPGNVGCYGDTVTFPDGGVEKRIPYKAERGPFDETAPTCGDCGVMDGGLHHRECDMEVRPRCGKQLMVCAVGGCELLEELFRDRPT